MRWLLGVIGIGLLAYGAREINAATGEAGGVALLVAGVLLLLSPFVINRVEQFSLSGTGFEVRLSREIAELGAPSMAKILDSTDLTKFAESYGFVHDELKDKQYEGAKVHLQDLLVDRAASVARLQKFDPSEVRTLFRDGSPLLRVLTLGLMLGDPSLADGVDIASAISESRSANEQYQGLRLAKLHWRNLSKSERQTIQTLIANDPFIADATDPTATDRRNLAKEIRSLPLT